MDVLATLVGQFIGKPRFSHQFSSALSLSQAAKLMKFVANSPYSRSTVQLIEIELSKAYLCRALRCKDPDSDSIYCLANVYLAVLYYRTGQYQTAIDHCTVVTRSQDHSQCSSHVVQGELLPKIDDDIDSVLGLAVFYQYVRTAALSQQQQTQHVSVFNTELFAHYLHIRCRSAVKCRQFTNSSADELKRYIKYVLVLDTKEMFTSDVLLLKSVRLLSEWNCHYKPLRAQQDRKSTVLTGEVNTSKLIELLQRSAVEQLTTFRQLRALKFPSEATLVTTDFESLYAYKRGEYRRCLQLSSQNVCKLLYIGVMRSVTVFSDFIQLLDEAIVSLVALALIVNPVSGERLSQNSVIAQMTLSLYLMTQCQLKLHNSVTSLAQTLHYIAFTQSRYPTVWTLDQLILKMTKRKIIMHSPSIVHCSRNRLYRDHFHRERQGTAQLFRQ